MKIPRIQTTESSVKHSFNFKQSTSLRLEQYQKCYAAEHGEAPALKDLVETMLLSFMAEDKDFQKFLKAPGQSKPAAAPAPAQLPVTGSGFGSQDSSDMQ